MCGCSGVLLLSRWTQCESLSAVALLICAHPGRVCKLLPALTQNGMQHRSRLVALQPKQLPGWPGLGESVPELARGRHQLALVLMRLVLMRRMCPLTAQSPPASMQKVESDCVLAQFLVIQSSPLVLLHCYLTFFSMM